MTEGLPCNRRQLTFNEYIDSNTGVCSRTQHPLASRITSILSTSYADSDIKDALDLLDKQGLKNTAAVRRQLGFNVQKEVLVSNGEIIHEFGHVARVSI